MSTNWVYVVLEKSFMNSLAVQLVSCNILEELRILRKRKLELANMTRVQYDG